MYTRNELKFKFAVVVYMVIFLQMFTGKRSAFHSRNGQYAFMPKTLYEGMDGFILGFIVTLAEQNRVSIANGLCFPLQIFNRDNSFYQPPEDSVIPA